MSGHLSRRQIALPNGTTTLLHRLAVRDPAQIMVVFCSPFDSWLNVKMSGQPTLTSITFINSGLPVVVNLAIMVLPDFIAPSRTDDY